VNPLGRLASNIGKGLLAGAVGTAAMTAVSAAEARRRGRKPSTVPGDAAARVLGVRPVGEDEKARFSNLAHWAYGIAWGGFRGLLGTFGVHGLGATTTHFAAVWGSALAVQPALGVTPPPTEWGATEVAIDAGHHAVYAVATGLAWAVLDWRS
jgi:hypothetical protein